MITWMQRKKKYLIVVLWITVISFVGAGFVGWGGYSYGKSSQNIASVGDIDISYSDFQRRYSNVFSYYNQILEGKVSDEQKRQIEQESLSYLITNALLLNYAHELGLSVSKDEVAKEIIKTPAFLANGVFDKNLYKSSLNRLGYKISEYEKEIQNGLIIQRLQDLLALPITDLEESAFSSYLRIKTKLEYKVFNSKDIKINPSLKEQKDYYEKNKANFVGEATFDVSYIQENFSDTKITDNDINAYYQKNQKLFIDQNSSVLPLDSVRSQIVQTLTDEQTKTKILKQIAAWKKNQATPKTATNIELINNVIPYDAMQEADLKADLKISKSIKTNDGYIVFKIDKKHPPKQLSFDDVKTVLAQDLKQDMQLKALQKNLEENSKNFKGKILDFTAINETSKVGFLDESSANLFLSQVFSDPKKSGFINFGDKGVVYKVLEQKLFATDSLGIDPKQAISQSKNQLLMQDLIQNLQKKYEITNYHASN